ncbi:MAG: hypothetical protein ABFR97_06135 [Thermodesulfobacteriota bacterium]
MTEKKDWHCAKITNCQRQDQCPAGRDSSKACWEIASELQDYRSVMNVCQDCLVYISHHQEDSNLTQAEIEEIMAKKGVCVLEKKCLDK